METDANLIQPKKKSSFYYDDEEINVKPSTELVPDEYEHYACDMPSLHIFRSPLDEEFAEELLENFKEVGYEVDPENQIHLLEEKKNLEQDLDRIKENSHNKNGLILVFFGVFRKDGTFLVTDDNGDQEDMHVKDIWNKFSSNNCPELKDKPKVFIFCTSKYVKGLQTDSTKHITTSFDKVYDFPAESDILIIYKKINNSNLKDKQEFLDQFCDNIRKYSKKYDIIDLVIHTQTENKSSPLIISTLTRKFYITSSKQREHYLSIIEKNTELDASLKNLQESLQRLMETKKKKRELKSIFSSFRKKVTEKPKVEKRVEEKGKPKEKESANSSRKPSTSSSAVVRRRTTSESSDFDRSRQPARVSQEKPRWKP